ncbi:MAG: iron-sulfur cluster assembly protein, partial [Gemmatimonadetes bacterium]|nr:iron-sulfur cluster assembly protein [Gemmatimonadota bacterium]
MRSEETRRRVMAALAQVRHPVLDKDVLATGHVRDIEVDSSGEVRFAFLMRADDPPDLVKRA